MIWGPQKLFPAKPLWFAWAGCGWTSKDDDGSNGSMGGVASAGKVVARSVAKPFKRKAFWGGVSTELQRKKWNKGDLLDGGFKYVLFSPLLGEDESILTHIFQRGWNYQPVLVVCTWGIMVTHNRDFNMPFKDPFVKQPVVHSIFGNLSNERHRWFHQSNGKQGQFTFR